MDDSIKSVLNHTEDLMKKALLHLESELLKVRAGKASPVMLDGVMVEYYGSPTPVSQVGAVSVADARTLTIKPWEKNMIGPIERAIQEANLGINPQNDGELIRLPIPRLTEDRRKDLVKQAKAEGEHAKVSIRNIRQEANNKLKNLHKDGVAEDEIKNAEKKIQDSTNKYATRVDEILKGKEDEIMTV